MSVYQEGKNIINRICSFLESNKFKYEKSEDGTSVKVYNPEQIVEYYAWDLYLVDYSTKALGATLDLGFVVENAKKKFSISTKAVYDLKSYVYRTNKTLQLSKQSDILAIFLSENLDINSTREFSISTLKYNGTWVRSEYNRSEILYCAIKDYIPVLNSDGSYRYAELTELYDLYKDKK